MSPYSKAFQTHLRKYPMKTMKTLKSVLILLTLPLITVGAESSSPLMAKVRDATEPFKDVNVAIAAGFVQGTMCVNVDGRSMGIYFVHSDLIGGSALDVNQPQALIYEPLSNGSLRLVGAEYIMLASVWTKQHPGANPPALEGQPLNLVESPISYRRADYRHSLPAFYDLSVLAWEHNPVGTFADWSTGVSCVQQPSQVAEK